MPKDYEKKPVPNCSFDRDRFFKIEKCFVILVCKSMQAINQDLGSKIQENKYFLENQAFRLEIFCFCYQKNQKLSKSIIQSPSIQLDNDEKLAFIYLIFFLAQFQYYMAKRPVRSTRGQLPPHLRQESTPPKISKTQPEDQRQIQRKQMESKRKMNQLLNLKKYPFGRAVHYFFNLDDFPRASDTVSYVINEKNYFSHTYSKDEKMINQTKIENLVNRRLMGLPVNLTGQVPSRKENKCKNVCYAYLFDIEDKKHNNDRIIFTIKLILKRLDKTAIKELETYQFIKKDSELQEILSEQMSSIERRQRLQQKLNNLHARKESNRVNWQFQDSVLYYHALNQKLHNAVVQLKAKLTQEYFYRFLFEKQQLQYQYSLSNLSYHQFLTQMISYYHKNTHSISLSSVKHLVANFRLFLGRVDFNGRFLVNYPVAILHFGKSQLLRSHVEFLLARRAFSMGQVQFYEVKSMIKKLFKRELKLKAQKISTYEQYYKNFRKRYEEICKFKKSKVERESQSYFNYPLLDYLLDTDIEKGSSCHFFNVSEGIQITKKQFIFCMIYFWLHHCIAILYPYLSQFQDLLEIIGSDFYPKVCNPLVEAIGSPFAGLIFYVFQAFCDLMNKPQPLSLLTSKFILRFDQQSNNAIIWREQIKMLLEEAPQSFEATCNKKIKRK